jgi:hypothetical protein
MGEGRVGEGTAAGSGAEAAAPGGGAGGAAGRGHGPGGARAGGLLGHAFFLGMLARGRAWGAFAGVLLLSAVLGAYAAKVEADFSIEFLFPERSAAKSDYDRYKSIFPFDEARALVMVEAPDLWTPTGLSRVAALEKDLGALAGTKDVEGPLSIREVIDAGNETVRTQKLFPRPDLPAEVLAAKRVTATADPLFAWRLSPPDGRAATIRVTLLKEVAAKDRLRNEFYRDLRALVARHEGPTLKDGSAQKVTISGLPVIRSEYTEMIQGDQATLLPIAFAVILGLLYLTFRSPKEIVAASVTIIASIVWTRGAMGILGYPEQILTSIVPTVVMIISISDTVHILTHYKEALAEGRAHEDALAHAMADSAWPCLLTEVTIAVGFLTLWLVDILMISQFGIATAAGMLLTWLANVTVLPLAIHALRPSPAAAARQTGAERAFAGFIAWVERQVSTRPRVVVAVATAVIGLALHMGSGVGREYYGFEGLRPESRIKKEIEYAEATYGGCNPLVIFIEPREGAPAEAPMLEPEAFRLMDRLAAALEELFPVEVKNALSAADYLKKAHRIFAGAEAADASPIPPTRALVAQELDFVDDGKILADFLDFERRTAAVAVNLPDVGSTRIRQIMAKLRERIAAEEAETTRRGLPVKLTLTGLVSLSDDIYTTLVLGLLQSLLGAVAVSLAVFSLVLRSWKLGLIALIPNVLPLALTMGFMGALGIQLTPTTVIVFSITLVIADDDTVQYFSRFRLRYLALRAAGEPDPHAAAAFGTLREAGLPMFITSCAVSLGFATLVFSNFLGLADFGVLIGISLFTAIFADLFLAPIMLTRIRPRIGGAFAGENAMSRGFVHFEKLGYDVSIIYGRARGGAWETIEISHIPYDGINGFAHVLNERGLFDPAGLPPLRKRAERPFVARWANRFRQYLDVVAQFGRPSRKWAKPAAAVEGRPLAWIAFSMEETARIRGRAREEGVSVNVLLLHRLHQVVAPRLEPGSPHPAAWIVPANLYEDWSNILGRGVLTSIMELEVRDDDGPKAIQEKLTAAIAAEAYWGPFLGAMINDPLPAFLNRAILSSTVAKKMRVGTLTNAGKWSGRETAPDEAWSLVPPVHPGQPLGCGVIEWNDKLGLGLKADGSLGLNAEALAALAREWREALLR